MTPCPEYLPSNLTAEETLRALEPCLPPFIMGHIEQLTLAPRDELKWAEESVEEEQNKVAALEQEKKDVGDQYESVHRALLELNDLFEDVLALIPKTRHHRTEVTTFEKTLAEALKL